ncbi:hypothetical protein YH65_03940 [Sulfurovum lithotrophicum]|uniref:SCP domain-containing protein n=1 Tax=Sulfurovum lithotrophicum TaxID=206403 RepID=A0A7U4M0L0_9BACT|nr:CAP domain-containing protein [Sulfurovum lithotrophicum]AKF24632.1 hypothetical protein YH65_03940 [Sulfurovum lithotrophicum]
MLLKLVIFMYSVFVLLQAGHKEDALRYLNTIRQHTGLIELRSNTVLEKAAKSHAKYLLFQQQYGHYEKKGRKGYTGRTPSDRVLHAGYPARDVMENVSVNAKNTRQSIDTLFAAIYHRFVFLNFDKNEIGIGSAYSKKKRRIVSTFVYLLGSSEVSKLCKETFFLQNGLTYMNELCRDPAHLVPQYLYEERCEMIRRKNSDLIVYPYPDATGSPPVFYTEHPHPLPGSKVSGYPISVQFNPAYYNNIKLKKFRLFNAKGKEIKKRKILTYSTDINQRFTPFQFAFMPLKRLDYDQTYQVEFEAMADEKRIQKRWEFRTKGFKQKLYRITKRNTTVNVKKGEKIVLFFEPRSNQDVLECINYTDKLHITCHDQNTLLVTVPKNRYFSEYTLNAGGRSVTLKE